MLFRRRSVDGEDARQGDGRELNLRVLIISMLAAVAILAVLYFAFGFGSGDIIGSNPNAPPAPAAPQ